MRRPSDVRKCYTVTLTRVLRRERNGVLQGFTEYIQIDGVLIVNYFIQMRVHVVPHLCLIKFYTRISLPIVSDWMIIEQALKQDADNTISVYICTFIRWNIKSLSLLLI